MMNNPSQNLCEICGDNLRVGKVLIANCAEFDICFWCYEDKEKFKNWFIKTMEEALKNNPDFEQLPDGKWRSIK